MKCRTAGGGRLDLWMVCLGLCTVGITCPTGCRTQPTDSTGIETLRFTDFGAHADFVARWREREQTSKTTDSRIHSEETIFEESIGLETEGYAYHPNFLEFALGGVFGLVQEDFEDVIDGRRRHESNTGDLTEFDLDARMFKRKPYPLTMFAHRGRGIVPRPFLPSLETTTTNFGLTWQYVSKKIPSSFQFSHTDAELTPLFVAGRTDEDGRQRNTELRFETGYHFNAQNVLSFTYEHRSVDEEPFELDYDADEITLSHRLEFGGQSQHDLRSELFHLNQSGTIDIERTRWREDLRLKHSDTLQSLFQFEFLDRTRGNRFSNVPDVEERSILLSGALRHQLYQSLTSQLRLYVRRQEFEPDLKITRWGGETNFNYRKINRWGVLYANYGYRAERNDHRGESRTNEVVDEARTFQDPDPIRLNNRNALVGSIFITAEDRVTIYQRGRDFVVQTFGNIVEIERVPTGRIANGETVLIDYLFSLGGSFELDTIAHTFGIRQDFEFGLTPYYRFEWQDQSISPTTATGAIAEDITGHVVGVEYRKTPLRLFAEYEDHDSNINPFFSSRFGASYLHRFGTGAETSLHGRWTDTTHGAPRERDIRLLTLEGRYRHPITDNLTVESSVLYRNGEDSVSRDTEGIDATLSMEWSLRQTDVKMSFEYSDFEDEFTENESCALFVHVKRRIWQP